MMMTLLDIVQDILNDIDSDEVNSIDDTIESVQVAQIVKSTFFAMMSNRDWPHLKRPIQLIGSTNPDLPTHMSFSEGVKEMSFVNYDKGTDTKQYGPVRWLEPDDFLRVLNRRRSDADWVRVVSDPSGIELLIADNTSPTYYTSFNDETVVFDSYDSSLEATLQGSKVQSQAYVMPTWLHVDDHIPDLPSEAFTALLEESKSRASIKLRQQQDIKAEQESQKQQRWLSQKAWRVKGGVQYPDFGRRGRKHARDATFRKD